MMQKRVIFFLSFFTPDVHVLFASKTRRHLVVEPLVKKTFQSKKYAIVFYIRLDYENAKIATQTYWYLQVV